MKENYVLTEINIDFGWFLWKVGSNYLEGFEDKPFYLFRQTRPRDKDELHSGCYISGILEKLESLRFAEFSEAQEYADSLNRKQFHLSFDKDRHLIIEAPVETA
jgi:hypothetical protein